MDRAALLEADAPERREGGGGDVGGGNPRRRPLAEGVERRGKVGGVLVRSQQSVCHRHHRLVIIGVGRPQKGRSNMFNGAVTGDFERCAILHKI